MPAGAALAHRAELADLAKRLDICAADLASPGRRSLSTTANTRTSRRYPRLVQGRGGIISCFIPADAV